MSDMVSEELWAYTTSVAPPASMAAALTSTLLSPPPEVERIPFPPSCLKQVKSLVSKENSGLSLASIGAEEVAFQNDVTTTQAFDVETKGDSSIKESDCGDSDLDYQDDKKASVLSDKEKGDEQTAEQGIESSAVAKDDGVQLTWTSNLGDAVSEDTADTQENNDG